MSFVRLAAFATLLLAAAPALAEQVKLSICQHLVGDETSCTVDTNWSVEKIPWDDFILDPDGDTVGYTVTVTEGETSYRLDIVTVVTLKGQIIDGTELRSIVSSVQLQGAEGRWVTVASSPYGEVDDNCGCGFVDNGQMTVDVRDSQGQALPEGQDVLIDYIGYGDTVYLVLRASYDLGQGVILPNSRVRVQNCVNFASVEDHGVVGCVYEGGAVRTTKACSPFDFESYKTPGNDKVVLVEELGVPDHDFIELSDFSATATSDAPVFPTGPVTIVPGGEKVSFQIEATGDVGTHTIIDVEGTAQCVDIVACDDDLDGVCIATLENMASLQLSEDIVADWANVQLGCRQHDCDGVVCDDGDPCTADTCIPGTGCVSSLLADNAPCEDGDPCTIGDSCIEGVCVAGEGMDCPDDNNPCTETWCDPVAGCVTGWAELGTSCEDGNICTNNDTCKYGNCWPGEEVVCGSANPCAEGACDPTQGCIEVPRDGQCDDGDSCTHDDYCLDGVCVASTVTDCDDGDPCTNDSCDAFDGCVHTPHEGACEDGDPCTEGESCVAGQCVGGEEVVCPAGGNCTVGVCDPARGCVYDTAPDGSTCDDHQSCTGCPWPEAGVSRGFRVTAAAGIPGFDMPDDYVIWLSGLFGGKAQVRLREYGPVYFLVFDDDTAVLRGQVDVFDDGGGPAADEQIWDLEVRFVYRGEGEAGQGLGGPKRELGMELQGFEWTDLWRYWCMTEGFMRGTTTDSLVTFTARPSPGVFPWQVGPRANDRNLNFGGAMWMSFERQAGADVLYGLGDINVDLEEVFCGEEDTCHSAACVSGETSLQCASIQRGDYCTYTSSSWAQTCWFDCDGDPNDLLTRHWSEVVSEAAQCNGLPCFTIGFSNMRRFQFSSERKLSRFVKFGDSSGVDYNGQMCNPSPNYASEFTKRLIGLKINVLLSDSGTLPSPRGVPLGDLVVAEGSCQGHTVRDVVHRAEMVFAGLDPEGDRCDGEKDLTIVISSINAAFESCERFSGYVDSPF